MCLVTGELLHISRCKSCALGITGFWGAVCNARKVNHCPWLIFFIRLQKHTGILLLTSSALSTFLLIKLSGDRSQPSTIFERQLFPALALSNGVV